MSARASDDRSGRAALAIGVSALFYSLAPVMIHLTAKDTAPFLFNMVIVVGQLTVMGIFLRFTRDHIFESEHSTSIGVRDAFHFNYLERDRSDNSVKMRSADPKRPLTWIKTPLIWMVISTLEFGFFVWATKFVETGIAGIVWELWPVFVVYGLARFDRRYARYYNQTSKSVTTVRNVPREHIGLVAFAVLGLIFMLGSQTADSISSPLDIFGLTALLGIALALGSSVLGAVSFIGTYAYGKIMYSRLGAGHTEASKAPVKKADDNPSEQLLWLNVFSFVIGRVVALPMLLLTAVLGNNITEISNITQVSLYSLLGATLLGIGRAFGNILLRWGNLLSSQPAVNAISFFAPLFALLWLMMVGIALPRFDLFMVGAVLILAVNILIQLKPDEERDVGTFGKSKRTGGRLGFTIFILSIWTFGTFTYVRDELLPADQLLWEQEEYWGLIALSATVFALILGFRVARLSSRITHEDEMTFELFRECEHLVEVKVLPADTLEMLNDLDTAQPKTLLQSYIRVRKHIRSAKIQSIKSDNRDNINSLASVAAKLDKLTHSKQQGRDIVELLSLNSFAVVTIGLGLLARPIELGVSPWSGFLSEVFILLFVSTVSFLCVNLFDIRRERETPLLVRIKQLHNEQREFREYGVFFRYKRDLTVQHLAAVLISIGMSITFCVLLYGKWL